MNSNIIYVGVKAHVAAIDRDTGEIRWQTKLKGGLSSGERFVSLLVQDGRVYAHTYGELFCLDQETGEILWTNSLDGLGYDIASLAVEGRANSPELARAVVRKKQAEYPGTTGGAMGGAH